MKKIIILLSGIFIVFCFLNVYDIEKENYIISEWENTNQGETPISMIVNAYDDEVSSVSDAEYIIDLASKHNVTVAKNMGSSNFAVHQFICINSSVLEKRYNLDSKEFNISDNLVISSSTTLSTAGLIPEFNDSVIVVKKSFMHEDFEQLDGWYFVYGANAMDFYNEFSNHYSNEIQLVDEQYHDHDHEEGIEYSNNMISFGIIFLCSSLIILLIYFSNKSREIAIKKINGYSTLKILKDEILMFSIKICIFNFTLCGVLFIVFFNSITDATLKMIIYLIYIYLSIVVMMLIVYAMIIIYLKTISTSVLIKKKKVSKFLIYINVISRIAFVFFLVNSIIIMLPSLESSISVVNGYNKFVSEADNKAHLTSFNNFVANEQFMEYHEVINSLFNDKGYVSVYTGSYSYAFDEISKAIIVNHKYIDKYSLVDIDGNVIDYLDNSKEYILIPEIIRVENIELYDELIYFHEYELGYDVVILESGQEIFTFDPEINDSTLGYAKDAVIVVYTDVNFSDYYFDVEENTIEKLEEELKDAGVDLNFNYTIINDEVATIRDAKIFALLYDGLFVVLYVCLIILLIIQYIILMFDVNKVEYAVKKINGFTFYDRYVRLAEVLVTTYLANFVLMKFLRFDDVSLMVLFGVLIIDIIASIIIVTVYEKKTLAKVLKGE